MKNRWKVKKSNCPLNVGRERVKVEKSFGKLPQNALLTDFPQNFYTRGKFFIQMYVIKGLPTILETI